MKKYVIFSLILFVNLLFFVACNKSQVSKTQVSKIIPSNNPPAIIDSNYISNKTTYFNVKNDTIYGEGKETLKKIFQESQFVMYGEKHNSKETAKLIAALIPMMNNYSYNSLCLEIGPHSASKVNELIKPFDKTVENIKQFNSAYYRKEFDDVPIPFMSGIEDAKFLANASKYNMNIWGLDQEYFYSILYLTDQLLKEAIDNENYKEIQSSKQKADEAILKWFKFANDSEKEVPIFEKFLNDADVMSFFKSVNNVSPKASEIITDIKLSWDIYTRWRTGSHADRISYMRNNFMKNYEAESQNNQAPKVFLKFGAVHASQILSLGTYDLGHLLNELASKNNTKCTNINSWTRYYLEDGKEVDYLTEYKKHYERLKRFMNFAKRDEWTIIDLESIRADVKNNKIALPKDGDFHKLNSLIQGYDYQFILPVDQYITDNIEGK